MSNQIKKWAKVSKSGYPIPKRCRHCKSIRTVLVQYRDGSRYVECEGCNTVLHTYGHQKPPKK